MESNTVDVSPERVAAEFATIRAEAQQIHPPIDTAAPGQAETQAEPHQSDVKMGASGFEIPDIPTGDLCCFVGGIAANVYAPNWVAQGFSDTHIESIGRPLGHVIDKYMDKYFPDQNLGDLVEPWKEEIALAFAAVSIYATFGNVPRQLQPIDPPEPPHQENEPDPEGPTDFNFDTGVDEE